MSKQTIEISKTEDGIRLQRWFLRHYPGMPFGEFNKLCRGGQIRVNSSRCHGKEVLRSGDQIRIPPTIGNYEKVQKKQENGEKFSFSDLEELRKCIIYSDDDIVAFDKPAGLAVQGGTGIKKSVDKMAAAMFPYDKISLVHRLDKETSGVLIVAKNQNAAQVLAKEFQDKTANKEYLALLVGNVSPNKGTIDNFLTKGSIAHSKNDISDGLHPQRAITDYKVLSNFSGILSWVLFSPRTGRTHQLRLHSAFTLNAPIVGDTLYNKSQQLDATLESVISTNNLFLFAYRISFRHPSTGKIITVTAQMPKFMKTVVEFLELKIPD